MQQGNNAIIIKTAAAMPRTITRKDGSKVVFVEQSAAIERGEDFPQPFKFTLDEGQQPYPPGRYYLDPGCLEVGDFDSLKVGRRVKLIKAPEAK